MLMLSNSVAYAKRVGLVLRRAIVCQQTNVNIEAIQINEVEANRIILLLNLQVLWFVQDPMKDRHCVEIIAMNSVQILIKFVQRNAHQQALDNVHVKVDMLAQPSKIMNAFR